MAQDVGTDKDLEQLPSLQESIDFGLAEHLKVMEDISIVATNEFEDKQKLDAMKEEWREVKFELNFYKYVLLRFLSRPFTNYINCFLGTLESEFSHPSTKFKKRLKSIALSHRDYSTPFLLLLSMTKWKSGPIGC
jgi:Dynein heavy chain, N-terminal region 2